MKIYNCDMQMFPHIVQTIINVLWREEGKGKENKLNIK